MPRTEPQARIHSFAMDPAKLRAWWSHRQALDGSLQGASAGKVLERSGWARSVGGAGPYLALFARAGLPRVAVDAAVARLEIHELPSARGCTYVLPESDFALGLTLAQNVAGEMTVAERLGVTQKEIAKLCDEVLRALENGPLDPEQIREATGKASRNLGPEGKKKGLVTTLPVALGKLQVEGEIRRVSLNGRLDQQRYRYMLWRPNPLAELQLSFEEACGKLAQRYFSWIGPATVAQFQQFAGIGVRAAKAAVEPLKLVPCESGSDRLMPAEDREQYERCTVPKAPRYSLVGGLDSMLLLRRELSSLVNAEDAKRKVPSGKDSVVLGGLADLESHAIFDRGRIVGIWEYDPARESIAWIAFVPGEPLAETVAKTEEFVRTQLGDMRSFSLDSPASRAPRIATLRKMGAN